MIAEKDIEKPRSPLGLRKFVSCRMRKIKSVKSERHKAILRNGIYNVFVKEIIPLSIFALKAYPNACRIEPKLGNQGYDAIVKDTHGGIIDYIELTFPDDWEARKNDEKALVSRGHTSVRIYSPSKDIECLKKHIVNVCKKKSKKDYGDCTLVIVISFYPPFREFRHIYSTKIQEVLTEVKSVRFKAKRVFSFF